MKGIGHASGKLVLVIVSLQRNVSESLKEEGGIGATYVDGWQRHNLIAIPLSFPFL